MIPLFTITLLVSASLLFAMQPMFAKMILPVLGGAPAVWNTCVLFFQTALFAGYLYAHLTVRWLGARRQATLHVVLMLIPLALLPVAVSPLWTPPSIDNPAPWLLGRMLLTVGPPFFVVAASAPLLQRWFASSSHRNARDPYFLYAASNVGSILALVAYPVAVEPLFRLRMQSVAWSFGYGALIVLVGACAVAMWRSSRSMPETAGELDADGRPLPAGVTWSRRFRWLALAAVPSSLMLSLTTYISTDIAAIPLLWIIPLLLYLLTFVLAFARRAAISPRVVSALLPLAVLPTAFALVSDLTSPMWLIIPLHLVAFFLAALACHQELARLRPAARDLTDFYVWMSLGGALGGIFNALVAPQVFTTAAEYPLGLVIACFLRPAPTPRFRPNRFDLMIPAVIGLMPVLLAEWVPILRLDVDSLPAHAFVFGVPLLVAVAVWRNRLRFGLTLAAILLAGVFVRGLETRLLYVHRNFFGITRVMLDEGEHYRMLVDGRTLHGMQALQPAREREPLGYYNQNGPVGQLFASFEGPLARRRVAAVGLGAGSMACYGTSGQRWTFYEINPAAVPIARDGNYFTYIRDCLPMVPVVLGDARLTIGRETGSFDLIILDAFSSDAIPVHLITREAFALYLRKLAPGGVLFFHISNHHIDLAPVLGTLARDAALTAIVQRYVPDQEDRNRGGFPSVWVAMARRAADLSWLPEDGQWSPLAGNPRATPWSDDFSNIVSVIKWRN
ncbi:MAG TPA: fused MFS/spermidine synthase [Vicinamibacterales bacterium]|nr:fused MFS/spermidine synthase [Vicinamibacterales bacterium]